MEEISNTNIEQVSNNISNADDNNNSLDNIMGLSDDANNSFDNMSLANDKDNNNYEPVNSDDIHNNIDDNSITYYTREELIELGKPENRENIDTNRVPPEFRFALKLFQSSYTKKFQELSDDKKELAKLKEDFEDEKKSFQAELENYKKELETSYGSDILETGRLSYSDVKDINNYSIQKASELLNEDVDLNDQEHINLLNSLREDISNKVVAHRINESINNRLVNKFGDDFVTVERAVQQEFKKLPYEDSVTLLKARQSGRYDIVEKFYTNVYQKLLQAHQNQNKPNISQANNNIINIPKNSKMPPNTLPSNRNINKPVKDKYDISGIL